MVHLSIWFDGQNAEKTIESLKGILEWMLVYNNDNCDSRNDDNNDNYWDKNDNNDNNDNKNCNNSGNDESIMLSVWLWLHILMDFTALKTLTGSYSFCFCLISSKDSALFSDIVPIQTKRQFCLRYNAIWAIICWHYVWRNEM